MKKTTKKVEKKPEEKPKAKKCELCGKMFIPNKTGAGSFLCMACRTAAKEKGGWWSHRTCAHCGRKWLVWMNQAGLCPDCSYGWRVQRKQTEKTESPKWMKPAGYKENQTHKCKNCGKSFKPYEITYQKGRITCIAGWRTCSWNCTAALLKKEEKSV